MKMHLIFETDEEIAKGVAMLTSMGGITIHYVEDATAPEGVPATTTPAAPVKAPTPPEKPSTPSKKAKAPAEVEPTSAEVLAKLQAFTAKWDKAGSLEVLHRHAPNFNALQPHQYATVMRELDDEWAAREKVAK